MFRRKPAIPSGELLLVFQWYQHDVATFLDNLHLSKEELAEIRKIEDRLKRNLTDIGVEVTEE